MGYHRPLFPSFLIAVVHYIKYTKTFLLSQSSCSYYCVLCLQPNPVPVMVSRQHEQLMMMSNMQVGELQEPEILKRQRLFLWGHPSHKSFQRHQQTL
jgi:hypothetical protein